MRRDRAEGKSRAPPGQIGRLDAAVYAAFAGVLVLTLARLFYSSERLQFFYSSLRGDPYLPSGDWSAPLDDVFIHFDFARSAARGHPFEWVIGNGYSSGGTSLLYPLVLAPGYWLGFRGEHLMQFAAVVACTSVFGALLASRRLFRSLPRWTSYLAPPALLSIGALDWSLFSGMEVAFFLAVWSVAFVAWDDMVHAEPAVTSKGTIRRALPLGIANAVLVATRPEAVVVALIFGIFAALAVDRREGRRSAFIAFATTTSFAIGVVVAVAVANRVLTGDFSAAGAVVKLEMNDPRLTAREVLAAWVFHVRYQVARVTDYHVGGGLAWGSLLWVLAALPLGFSRTRRYAAVLWAQAIAWVLLVALNGQVRWQNERYTMPALAWLLLSAALGVGVALTPDSESARKSRLGRPAAIFIAVVVPLILAWRQVPKMRDQAWFFGRASRNIRDQHIKVGRLIPSEIPGARRVLVGDAGAIPYASDMPALDVIGLGGYEGLPFARASRWGIAAAIELIERIPAAERPDVLAIYPGWWAEFPLWFGRPLTGVSVRGNVICGGLTKMIYAADWSALDGSDQPSSTLEDGEHLIDEVDFGDVVGEAAHRYRISGAPGFVAMKLLQSPEPEPHGRAARAAGHSWRRRVFTAESDPAGRFTDEGDGAVRGRPLWDAGRVVPPGASVRFVLRGWSPGAAHRIILRTAPSESARISVRIDARDLPEVVLERRDGWVEPSIAVSGDIATDAVSVMISATQNEVVLYHLWSVERR